MSVEQQFSDEQQFSSEQQYDFDLLVIGGGSGGVRAARMAAALGKRVAIVERQYWGGTCVNVGCIPKKLFHYAAQYNEHFHEATGFGWQVIEPVLDWPTLVAAVHTEVQRLNDIYASLLRNAGVQLLEGEAGLVNANTVAVAGRHCTAARILLATGGAPQTLAVPGAEHAITSDQFFSLSQKPQRAVVVGGGYIAVELAGVLQGLGVQTTLLHRGDTVLKQFDVDVQKHLLQEMRKKDLRFQMRDEVLRIDRQHDALHVSCHSGVVLETDCVLFATGRKPATDRLGLNALGIRCSDGGYIVVNEHFQTAVPSVHAIGDVVGRKELTPVALTEAMWLVDHWYGSGTRPLPDYDLIATAVFSSPEVATAGLTQAEAEQRFGCDDVLVFRSEFRALKHTVSGSSERTLMKLLVRKSTDRVLGLHMVGAEAGEIVQGFAVALQMGATKAQWDQTVGIHPTVAEEFVTLRTPVAR